MSEHVRIILTESNSIAHWPNGSVEFIGSAATPCATFWATIRFARSLRKRNIPYEIEHG